MARLICAAIIVALIAVPAFTQSPEVKARIDYEAAKIALAAGDGAVALEKLEKVIKVLGPLPELLATAAQAAWQSYNVPRAKELVQQALTTPDKEFQTTEQYKALIQLAAKIELEGPKNEAIAKGWATGYWIDEDTRLMWTTKDNGSEIYWNFANEYCRGMTLGGFAGWRLPSIDELRPMYPMWVRSVQSSGPFPIRWIGWTWSGTENGPSRLWIYKIENAQLYSNYREYDRARALCVRVSEK